MKVGDLVKPALAYRDDETDFVGIVVEKEHCDGGGHLEPETIFMVQWVDDGRTDEWQDFELELVSERR